MEWSGMAASQASQSNYTNQPNRPYRPSPEESERAKRHLSTGMENTTRLRLDQLSLQPRPSPLFTEPGYEPLETHLRPSAFGVTGQPLELLEQYVGPGQAYGQLRPLSRLMTKQVALNEVTMRGVTLVNPTLEKLISAGTRFTQTHQAHITCVTLIMDEFKRRMVERKEDRTIVSDSGQDVEMEMGEVAEPAARAVTAPRALAQLHQVDIDMEWQIQQWLKDLFQTIAHLSEYLPDAVNLIVRFEESARSVEEGEEEDVKQMERSSLRPSRRPFQTLGEKTRVSYTHFGPRNISDQMRGLNWSDLPTWPRLVSLRFIEDTSRHHLYSDVLNNIWHAVYRRCQALQHLQLSYEFDSLVGQTINPSLDQLQSAVLHQTHSGIFAIDIRNSAFQNVEWPRHLRLLACNRPIAYLPAPKTLQTLILHEELLSCTLLRSHGVPMPSLRYLDLKLLTDELPSRAEDPDLKLQKDGYHGLDFLSGMTGSEVIWPSRISDETPDPSEVVVSTHPIALQDVQRSVVQLTQILSRRDFWSRQAMQALFGIVGEIHSTWSEAELVRLDLRSVRTLWMAQVLSVALNQGLTKESNFLSLPWSGLRHLELTVSGSHVRGHDNESWSSMKCARAHSRDADGRPVRGSQERAAQSRVHFAQY